jgi:isoquinoline 1-oxidoreductase alpha subunit
VIPCAARQAERSTTNGIGLEGLDDERRIAMSPLDINGKRQTVDLPGETPLLWTLRDELGLTGTKFGCGMALCGACTVHVDGQAVRSCITPISAVANKKVVTIEAIGADAVGKALQAAWVDTGVPQCGYCQAGQIMSAAALLKRKQKPSEAEIDEAMSGNICRCGTYTRIRAAIKQATVQPGGTR